MIGSIVAHPAPGRRSFCGAPLSICRSIIEAHGGRMWVTANSPGGAVFQFTVPAVHNAAISKSSPPKGLSDPF
jgi:K+-sensing histidine kinase KdpD